MKKVLKVQMWILQFHELHLLKKTMWYDWKLQIICTMALELRMFHIVMEICGFLSTGVLLLLLRGGHRRLSPPIKGIFPHFLPLGPAAQVGRTYCFQPGNFSWKQALSWKWFNFELNDWMCSTLTEQWQKRLIPPTVRIKLAVLFHHSLGPFNSKLWGSTRASLPRHDWCVWLRS